MEFQDFNSPIGILRIGAEGHYLTQLTFVKHLSKNESSHPVLIRTCHQLKEYFGRERDKFELPLMPKGTEFQQQVWDALCDIPYGATNTYLELAKRLGNANSIRAVGHANAKNPIAIIIPCHRVIGAEGNLVGYSGGIHRKEWLLKHEGNLLL